MIVNRRALALAPHHDDDRVTRARIAVQKAPRVALARRDEQGGRERELAAADLLGQDRLHRRTDSCGVAGGDRHIDPAHESGYGSALHQWSRMSVFRAV